MGLGIAFLVLLVAFPAAVVVHGVEYTVGDSQGWNQGVDYSTWASGKTFTVGDTLVFNFLSNHQVNEVDQTDYNGCSSINLIKNYDSSPAKITLTKAGKSYYICPTPGHCDNGMKLMLTTVAATPAPAPTTSTPAPPTPSPKSAPAPPPTTPAPPTPTTPKSAPAPPPTTPTPPTTTPTPPTSTKAPPPPPATPKTSSASSLYMSLAGVPVVLATFVAFGLGKRQC